MLPFMGNDLLCGELVTLKRPTKDDAAIIGGWMADIEYQRMLRRGMVYPGDGGDTDAWFSHMLKEDAGYPFAIRRNDDDTLVGFLVIKDIMWASRNCSLVIGIGDKNQRGRGFGTDAMRVLLRYCFMEMNLYRVGLEVMAYNTGAIRAYTKAGFQPEGVLRGFVYRDGVYYDIQLMSVLRPEWEAQQAHVNAETAR